MMSILVFTQLSQEQRIAEFLSLTEDNTRLVNVRISESTDPRPWYLRKPLYLGVLWKGWGWGRLQVFVHLRLQHQIDHISSELHSMPHIHGRGAAHKASLFPVALTQTKSAK